MWEQIASILAVVTGSVMRFFSNAGRAMGSYPGTKVTAMIGTKVDWSLCKDFDSFDRQSAIGRSVERYVAEPHVTYHLATCTTDHLAFTVLNVAFFKRRGRETLAPERQDGPISECIRKESFEPQDARFRQISIKGDKLEEILEPPSEHIRR